MLGKKVVVKFKDGRILKGWTANISPNKEVFYLHKHKELRKKDKKDIVEVKLSSLRAVFFVKSHKGNKDYKEAKTFEGQPKLSPSQRKIIVTCKDGEKLYGTTLGYNPNKKGFFIVPIDPKDNNERIFIIQDAVKSVELLKFDKNGYKLI
ncbi:MAG TPA: hypothetical protein DCK79_04035 [Candidatus Atribacteria bacterium]|nr:hypothetical protein [Candidatus Atribacteria bacterium]